MEHFGIGHIPIYFGLLLASFIVFPVCSTSSGLINTHFTKKNLNKLIGDNNCISIVREQQNKSRIFIMLIVLFGLLIITSMAFEATHRIDYKASIFSSLSFTILIVLAIHSGIAISRNRVYKKKLKECDT